MPSSPAESSTQVRFALPEPFASLSEENRQRLQREHQLMRYRVGQFLADPETIAHQVLVIVEGEARLLPAQSEELFTLGKFGPGAVVGLASLLRACPCEHVTAATEIVAMALPDALVVDCYQQDEAFRTACDQQIQPAELADLQDHWLRATPFHLDRQQRRALLQQLTQTARLIPAVQGASALEPGELALLGSDNHPELTLGSPLSTPQHWKATPRPPFALRVVAIPDADLRQHWGHSPDPLSPADSDDLPPVAALGTDADQPGDAELVPLSTSLDVGQRDPSRNLQLIRAQGPLDETLACFAMLAKALELPFRRDSIEKILRDKLRRTGRPDLQLCGYLASMLGLHVTGARVPAAAVTRLQTPALVEWRDGFAVVTQSNHRGITLASPAEGWLEFRPDQIAEHYPDGIQLLLLDKSASSPEQRFGPSWFVPALKRHRGALVQVLVASFVVQLFGLANPLLIQVIIDKVISQRSMDTLQILGIALVVVTLLEGVIGSLRTFLFTETTNRIDLRLGAEVIDHLLRLPLNYFDRRPVGELATRVAELEKIRSFLTGQALTTMLDAAFSVIYIVVMVLYSWLLTLVSLAVIPIQVSLTLLGAPLFRRQIRSVAQENAKTQSHLVEILSGIQTVKAQNVEMVSRWKWQDFYSKYISRTFEKTITGTALTETSQVFQKLSQLLVLWVGASLVLDGQLTLGQLIAFRIISGYVTQPLLRLSTIWQNIQELRVSFERLADVVDTPEESDEADKGKIPLPPMEGSVRFEEICFSFSSDNPPVLKNVSVEIPAGAFVGIVGQSGSGKSTLMKLLPRLYAPDSGRILIDDCDISKVELYSLRRQIGIVPQEPLLFSGTINDNIALTDPDASSDDIVRAAKLACAHEFIMGLSNGYSTQLGERGAALSGGQRQRIAIARTLISRPKLLVMDEATSALDYDTERRLCHELLDNLHDCTVFFVTHRLNTIRRAQIILLMHQGSIAETGTHDELMALKGRYYALYRQQDNG